MRLAVVENDELCVRVIRETEGSFRVGALNPDANLRSAFAAWIRMFVLNLSTGRDDS